MPNEISLNQIILGEFKKDLYIFIKDLKNNFKTDSDLAPLAEPDLYEIKLTKVIGD